MQKGRQRKKEKDCIREGETRIKTKMVRRKGCRCREKERKTAKRREKERGGKKREREGQMNGKKDEG
jgi:hypothetical protein